MSTHHHPGDDLLLDYYRGALAPGLELAVRTHVELCVHCRAGLKLFDAIGGALMEEIDGVALSDSALDLALARIERPESIAETLPKKPVKRPKYLEGIALPASLQNLTIKDRYWVAPGVWLAPVDLAGQPKSAKTYLMHVKAGMAMPEHTHRGMEMTVMLAGRYRDHKGSYVRGDMSICDDSDDRHSPAMEGDEDCLCLVAQEAAIVPQSFWAWALKPIARI